MSVQMYVQNTGVACSYLYCSPANGMRASTAATTHSLWFNAATWPAGGTMSMFGFYDGNATVTVAPTTAIQIGTRSGTTLDVWTWGGTVLISSTGFTLPTNTWFHIAYTCTAISGGNMTHQLYINGVLNNTVTNALQIAGTFTQMWINGYPETTHQAETGTWQIDDARCYNRQLSSSEIMTMYTTRGSSDGIFYGAVCRYDLSEGYIGTSLGGGTNGAIGSYDLSGQGNHLVVAHTTASTAPTYVTDWADRYDRPAHS